jgi:sugar lactone lactonase YvrE
MKTKKSNLLLIALIILVLYFTSWPVDIDPVPWNAPENKGYVGAFKKNQRLKGIEKLPLNGLHGPEDIALDSKGRIYAPTHEGIIVRLKADGTDPQKWADTGGRPLGIDFDNEGNLIVADAMKGLLSISPDADITVLADIADGIPILYADDVDVAKDGRIYFSDASTKFGAKAYGDTMKASLSDIMEHGGHGRLLRYDPLTQKAVTLLDGINFANGVAVSHDQTYVLINETGSYRVLRYWISGPKQGQSEPLIENLPGFPDNLSTGMENRFWIALMAPRNKLVDFLSDKPFWRKVIQRLPAFVRPKATIYAHIVTIDGNGKVLESLQDPDTDYPQITGVIETDAYIYLGSLIAPDIGRIVNKIRR